MQDWRFDELTRTLSKATSRRDVFKGLLGGLVASAVARGGVGAVAGCDVAQCKADADALYQDEYQACKQDGSTGAGLCALWFLIQRYFNYKKCDRSGCFDGSCCNQQCTSLFTDPQNCGSCGHTCPPGQECSGGRCSCGGNTCGDCEDCVDGQCVSRCDAGTICCQNTCVSDQCASPLVFNPATCDCVCPGGDTLCNNQCVDTYNDDNNCGSCGNKCSNCEQCSSGVCTPINCPSGETCCNGSCLGSCPPGQQRDPSSCQCVCATGETCGPFCCDSSKVCCPDTLSGMSCRDPNGNCGCNTPCGDVLCCDLYTEICCRSADYSWHCIAPGGTC